MSDIRERLTEVLWEKFGVWPNGPLAAWLTEADCARFADTILNEFNVTERGVHNHDIDPACPETRLPDGSLRGACTINVMTAFDSPHGMWCPPGCGHDRSEAASLAAHDHEWQRRQNVTSRGYRMTPYEVCVVDGCDAARQVFEGEMPDD